MNSNSSFFNKNEQNSGFLSSKKFYLVLSIIKTVSKSQDLCGSFIVDNSEKIKSLFASIVMFYSQTVFISRGSFLIDENPLAKVFSATLNIFLNENNKSEVMIIDIPIIIFNMVFTTVILI